MLHYRIFWFIVFSPLLLILWIIVAVHFIWRLPLVICEWRRTVRWLPYAGLGYYGLVAPLVLAITGLAWWEIAVIAGMLALGGSWLLPDPFTCVLSPRKRRAVALAIAHIEAEAGPWPIYGQVHVVGLEVERTVVCVPIKGTKPPAHRFLAVADEAATVDDLDFGYVSSNHGVRAWWR